MSTPPITSIGTVAHFNLLERLEPSGPGDLYRARDTHHGRTVAVRLLPASYVADPTARAALIADARTLIALSHPNVAALFAAGEQDSRFYVAFEFVKGQSLRAEMAGRPMNPRRTLELAIQVADAVAEAHAAGFLHRGISPESIIVTEKGHAKIPTFHLASLVGFDPATGEMELRDSTSPEEARGEHGDERSDVFSIAAVAYEMLTARKAHLRGSSAPSDWNARVPRELDAVMLRALSPNPASRQQSAAALAAEFRNLAASLDAAEAAEDAHVIEPSPTASGVVWLIVALVAAAVTAAGWWFTRR